MEQQFLIGEIVQLKSGGPSMTVQIIRNDTVWCQWFSGSKLNRGIFSTDSLIKKKKKEEEEEEEEEK